MGFSLQANAKTKEGGNHPDRNAQFEHINAQVKTFRAAGEPAISVDIIPRKKSWLGTLKTRAARYAEKVIRSRCARMTS
jgi:Rhodopirellula transposase DDE domain